MNVSPFPCVKMGNVCTKRTEKGFTRFYILLSISMERKSNAFAGNVVSLGSMGEWRQRQSNSAISEKYRQLGKKHLQQTIDWVIVQHSYHITDAYYLSL